MIYGSLRATVPTRTKHVAEKMRSIDPDGDYDIAAAFEELADQMEAANKRIAKLALAVNEIQKHVQALTINEEIHDYDFQ